MSMVELIQGYGYWAVAAGAFLEGETMLLVAGAAASRGHLWLPAVVGVAALASFGGDQLWFYLGRRYGNQLLARYPSLVARTAHARALLERHHLALILSIRFLYGLRIAGPLAIGMSSVPWPRFFVLNAIGALLWALVVAGVGYGFGHAMAHWLAAIDADELWALAAVLLLGLIWWLWAHARHARHGARR